MAKPEKTAEEIAEDNKRTNEMGLFNTLKRTGELRKRWQRQNAEGRLADTPVRTLYYHAIELYLKSLLRQHYSVDVSAKQIPSQHKVE